MEQSAEKLCRVYMTTVWLKAFLSPMKHKVLRKTFVRKQIPAIILRNYLAPFQTEISAIISLTSIPFKHAIISHVEHAACSKQTAEVNNLEA